MEFNEIVDGYVKATQNYYKEEARLENIITKAQEKLTKLRNKCSPSWVQNILVPLAKELKKRLGLKAYDIYGPFGSECETSIYLSNYGKDKNIEITKVDTWSLTIRPHWKRANDYLTVTGFELTYWIGESTNEYAKGTLGELNGMNHIYKPLPNTIDEIIKILRFSEH